MRAARVLPSKIGHPAGGGNVVALAKRNRGLDERCHKGIRLTSTKHDRRFWKIHERRLEGKDEHSRSLRLNRNPRRRGQRDGSKFGELRQPECTRHQDRGCRHGGRPPVEGDLAPGSLRTICVKTRSLFECRARRRRRFQRRPQLATDGAGRDMRTHLCQGRFCEGAFERRQQDIGRWAPRFATERKCGVFPWLEIGWAASRHSLSINCLRSNWRAY